VSPDPDDAAALDEDGIPDLAGPLPEKAATGDPQEGVPPPSDRPASFDWGVTAAEEDSGEPLSVRVSHERPDFGVGAVLRDDDQIVLLDDADDGVVDREKDLVAEASTDERSLSAEEAALHAVDDAPGAVDRETDSYLDDE
jgi:hypothetical protein